MVGDGVPYCGNYAWRTTARIAPTEAFHREAPPGIFRVLHHTFREHMHATPPYVTKASHFAIP